ncbi:MAG: S8 family serine peptidase, partial [Acidobacteria bacterium]|nr:S8 family serine peptidase [Acidobacteriota bacterium]
TATRSLPNQADAGGGVITTGAIPAVNPHDPYNVVLEPFSGQGPTADGRIKPDVTGIDGVQVTGDGGFVSTFFGTSAAAPHIAGIAALLLQTRPDFLAGGGLDEAAARGFLDQFILTGAYRLGMATGQLTEPRGTVLGNDSFGAGRANALASAVEMNLPASCSADAATLCIDNQPGDRRFLVNVLYDATGGPAGLGNALALSSLGVTQGGLYWFFQATNPEMLIKVLNGCPVNDDFWMFYAAGTNVGLSVIVFDTEKNLYLVFTNPGGTAAPPIQDTAAFSCAARRDEPSVGVAPLAMAPPAPHNGGLAATPAARLAGGRDADAAGAAGAASAASPGRPRLQQARLTETDTASRHAAAAVIDAVPGCAPSATTLCIAGRFAIRVSFATATSSGTGTAIPLSGIGVTEGGLFWFFDPTNPEMLIKVIDACSLNDQHWVFFSAGTNVGLTVTVTDTQTGASKQYTNPNGTAAVPVQDTGALPCP